MTPERSGSSSATNPFSGSGIGGNDFLDVASTLPVSRQTDELLVEEVEIIDPKIEDCDIESPQHRAKRTRTRKRGRNESGSPDI